MIFVTGGTGLVGAHLLCELIRSGKQVKALKRRTSNLNLTLKTFSYYSAGYQELFNKINWVEGNILDYYFLEDTLAGVEEIYHCAAMVSFRSADRKKMISNNVEGTANLVNAALTRSVKKMCHVSSVASLGRPKNGTAVSEETCWIPSKRNSGYSESKFYSEAEVWRGIREGMDAVIVNPSIILGPGNWESGSPRFFKSVGDGLQFYTKGITGYVDVGDVVRAMILLMGDNNFGSCKNQRYLLSAENLSYRDFFNAIADSLGRKRPRFFASDFILSTAWKLAAFWSLFSGSPAVITRDAVSNSNHEFFFDGSKIRETLPGFQYRPVSESIKEISKIFLSEKNNCKSAKT